MRIDDVARKPENRRPVHRLDRRGAAARRTGRLQIDDPPAEVGGDRKRQAIGRERVHLDLERLKVRVGDPLGGARRLVWRRRLDAGPGRPSPGRNEERRRGGEVGRDVVDLRQSEGERGEIGRIGDQGRRQDETEKRMPRAAQPVRQMIEAAAPASIRAKPAMISAAANTVSAAGGSAACDAREQDRDAGDEKRENGQPLRPDGRARDGFVHDQAAQGATA